MSALFPDTSSEAEEVLLDSLRKAPTWRKIKLVADMNEMVRTLALSGLRERHPDASPEELRRGLADILLGADLAERAYGPRQQAGRQHAP